MKTIFTIFTIFIGIFSIAQSPTFEWVKGTDGSGTENQGRAIVVDAAGNSYSTGFFSGTTDFDPSGGVFNLTSEGGNDIYILKLDNIGGLVWAKQMGGTGANDLGYSIALDPLNNIYITGSFEGICDFNPSGTTDFMTSAGSSDIFVAKLDLNGNYIWAKQMGGTGMDRALGIDVDANGYAFTTGFFSGTADFDPSATNNSLISNGLEDIFISCLRDNGDYNWAHSFGSTLTDHGNSIFLDGAGNPHTTGYFTGTVDLASGAPTQNYISAGSTDIFVMKMDAAGDWLWTQQMGGTNADYANAITVDLNDNVITTGYFFGTSDFDPSATTNNLISTTGSDAYVSKLDVNGNYVWAKRFGNGELLERGIAIATDNLGNIYSKGFYLGLIDMDPGASIFNLDALGSEITYLSKLDQNGDFIWAYNLEVGYMSASFENVGNGICVKNDDIYYHGYYSGAGNFDPIGSTTNLPFTGHYDTYVLKLGQCFNTTSTINPIACNSYTTPSGNNTYTTSGTYSDIIPNAGGCDSIITINLVVEANCGSCGVGNYTLNNNAIDVSGYLNHGSIIGSIANTDRFGNVNGSLHFDGIDDYVEVPLTPSLNITSGFTISTWFITHDPFVADQTLVGQQRNSTNPGINLFYSNLTGGITISDGTNTSTSSASFGGYHMGKWHHVVATYNGSQLKIYFDGELKQNIASAVMFSSLNENFNFGRQGSLGDYLHGDLDDIKIYNCALTDLEIDSIFTAESPYEPCGFTVNSSVTAPTCHDGNNGSINLTVSGSQPPYAFYWNNNQNTEDLSNLFPGNYSIIINDDNGCDTMITYNVSNPIEMNVNLNISNPSCGQSNGSVLATVSNGGIGPFNFIWSNGDETNTADSLSAGIYMVTVSNPAGCTSAETFGVNNTGGFSLSAVVNHPSCSGVSDGSINLIISGGSSPFTYSWSDGSTTEDLSNLPAGAYMVEVTDDNGCVAVYNTTINSSSLDLSNVSSNNPTCGNNDGDILIIPSGGNAPYTYLWSSNAGSAITNNVSSLGAGTYFVNVTDDNGCSETQLISLSNSNGPSIVINSISGADCAGNGGNINISVLSGTSPFTYEWSNGETTQDISDLELGNYSVDVTDEAGCITSLNVEVPGVTLDPMTLCMTTVDTLTGKVLCIWTKPALNYISHFNIYRENSAAGQFDFMFSRSFDSTSVWTDLTANPQIRGWRYKITYVDTCGNESPFGTNHKTLHVITSMGLSGGVNISWDHYEGFSFPTFYIERYHTTTGWVTIDSIPSTLHSYFDTTTLSGTLLYAINIKSPSSCDPTRVGVNTSRSNIRNQPTAVNPDAIAEIEKLELNIYPNPAMNEVNISLENFGGQADLKLFNSIGDLLFTQKINSNQLKIDTKDLPSGIYTISVSSEKNNVFKKLMIVK